MTTFRWYDGNLGFYGFRNLSDYSVTTQSTSQLVLRAGANYGEPYMAYRIVFKMTGAETWQNPDTDQTYYTAGRITGISYYNQSGAKIGDVTGLSVDAAYAFSHLNLNGDTAAISRNFWNFVQTQNPNGAVYEGSDNTGRADLPEARYFPVFDRGDDITTSTGNDTVRAGGDSDWITDMGGRDVYNGQAGAMDLVSYSAWRNMTFLPQTGIVADLAAGTVTGPDGFVDQLVSIEALRGTHHGDVIRGTNGANIFLPGGGSDVIDGRGGFDELFYLWDSGDGISANLALGIVRDGFGGRDRVTSIESVVGTYEADRFVDTVGAQRFDGSGGNDFFSLSGGNDTVTGGDGADTFKFIGRAFGTDRITDFGSDEGDRIHLTGAAGFGALTITEQGANQVISLGTSKIILVGTAGLALDAGDFIFG